MALTFRKIDRTNWREAIELRLRADQEGFVSSPVKSLAAAYVRQYGDEFEYVPMGIYDGAKMVGYIAMLCSPRTTDDYWIDDIMIDARYQGRGFGRAAVEESIRFMVRTYPRCETVKLSCHRNNRVAAALYESVGFVATGEMNANSGEPNYELRGDRMRAYR